MSDAPFETKTPKSIHERRQGALKGVLSAVQSRTPPTEAIECAKIEALFLIAEQLAAIRILLEANQIKLDIENFDMKDPTT